MDTVGDNWACPIDAALKRIQNPTTGPPLLPPTQMVQVIISSYRKNLQMDLPASP